ncbi:type II toxin-antitoxin system HicB family antitoxin [Laspinema palackyanum]|uniref:type II toxin-antitoxin system HicB family antitoxin n=1 Tax=Laspinema palackyanum TaxID=3231601 RepID=UPI00345CEB22
MNFSPKKHINHTQQLTAIIEREGNGYVSLCSELALASQGDTVEQARSNLIEALELFLRRLGLPKLSAA